VLDIGKYQEVGWRGNGASERDEHHGGAAWGPCQRGRAARLGFGDCEHVGASGRRGGEESREETHSELVRRVAVADAASGGRRGSTMAAASRAREGNERERERERERRGRGGDRAAELTPVRYCTCTCTVPARPSHGAVVRTHSHCRHI
jgi:hypothetical protein